jgi:hypothetical protein
MYFDGSLNIDGARAGVLFISPNKDELRYVLRLYFNASNNTVEYKAVRRGRCREAGTPLRRVLVFCEAHTCTRT